MATYSHFLIPLFLDTGIESRRNFFQKGAAVAAGVALGAPAASNAYLLPDLPYPCDALEPFIDTPTMVSLRDEV